MQLSDIPLVAAPLGGGPTTPALVLAAQEVEAFGFLAGGYLTAEALAADLEAVRTHTESFGVNLFVPERNGPTAADREAILAYRERLRPDFEVAGVELPEPTWDDDDHWSDKIDLLLGEPVRWVSFTFGLPGADVVDALHDAGSEVAITVTDPAEARAAEEQGADALVVQAASAGGHRGTLDQHAVPNDLALPDLLRAVGAVTTLPLLGGGGVGTAADVGAALKSGALAVQVGTALLLADEAGTSPTHRTALQDAAAGRGYDGTAVTRAFTGRWARGLHNGFIDRHADAPAGYPTIHHLTRPLRRHAAATGDPDNLHLWAGTGHRHVRTGPAGEILEALLP